MDQDQRAPDPPPHATGAPGLPKVDTVPTVDAVPTVDVVPTVDAVVVAYGTEPWLVRCVESLLASEGVDVRVVVVDNGGTGGATTELAGRDGVLVVDAGSNVGFAAGCNLGVEAGESAFVALVNHDAVVEPNALARLVEVAARPEVGLATAGIRLADRPGMLNSAGNDIHYLGLSWSGSFGLPAADHDVGGPVTGASGAGLACRREVWEALGGFDPEFFAYHEDADLSLRCWQQGLPVVYVPEAVVLHRYEFSRNQRKYLLIERNRLLMVLTTFGPRHLLVTAPALLALEVGMLVLAAAQGWLRAKLAGYRWLVSNRGWVIERRRRVQAARTVSDRELAGRFSARLDPGNLELPVGAGVVDRCLVAYWSLARRFL